MERPQRKRATATSAFGVSRRENHDASGFSGRVPAPVLSDDATVEPPGVVDQIYTAIPHTAAFELAGETSLIDIDTATIQFSQNWPQQKADIADNVLSGRRSGAQMARLYEVSAPTISRIIAEARVKPASRGS